jgi:hypothetical protein
MLGEEHELGTVRENFAGEPRGRLPQEFVDDEHLCGAGDVRRMHQDGKLSTLSLRLFSI